MAAGGEVVLITGAAGGIGAAAAERLSRRARVVLADLDGDRAESLAALLRAQGRDATAAQVDVADGASVRRMLRAVEGAVGPVTALFNNAGFNRRFPVEEITEANWDLMMRVHVKGCFLCAQAVLPAMCAARRGAIVNMSSDYAVMGMPGAAAYAAAKTAVYSLTKSLAVEFAPFNLRVNALGPGPIDTPLLRAGRTGEEWEAARARLLGKVPMGRLGRPEEVAAMLDFLLSERASYVTGQLFHPNGGQLSW